MMPVSLAELVTAWAVFNKLCLCHPYRIVFLPLLFPQEHEVPTCPPSKGFRWKFDGCSSLTIPTPHIYNQTNIQDLLYAHVWPISNNNNMMKCGRREVTQREWHHYPGAAVLFCGVTSMMTLTWLILTAYFNRWSTRTKLNIYNILSAASQQQEWGDLHCN